MAQAQPSLLSASESFGRSVTEASELVARSVPRAAESLANIHALFNAQSRGGMVYDHLPEKIRATLCFGARLSRNHVTMKLADMNDVDRAKLHRTINQLGEALKPLLSCPLSEFH